MGMLAGRRLPPWCCRPRTARGPPAGRPEVMVHRGCSASMPGTRIAHLPPRRGDHPLPAWLADARLDSAARLIPRLPRRDRRHLLGRRPGGGLPRRPRPHTTSSLMARRRWESSTGMRAWVRVCGWSTWAMPCGAAPTWPSGRSRSLSKLGGYGALRRLRLGRCGPGPPRDRRPLPSCSR